MATATNQTYNTDVYGIVRRLNRFIVEVIKSQSSGVSQTISFDVQRARTYIAATRAYVAWVISQPTLDLPETGPTAVDLPVSPVIPLFENESLFDLATLFSLARDEIANSQSSRLSSNLIPFDTLRISAILDKADAFLNNYVTVIDPLDQPETSPMTVITGPGLKGV
jgi:hypothetical protein